MNFNRPPAAPLRRPVGVRSLLTSLLAALSVNGCAVVAVADAAVSVAATAVSVTATVVETTVDITAAGVDAVIGDDKDE